jgi:hypothetical protein
LRAQNIVEKTQKKTDNQKDMFPKKLTFSKETLKRKQTLEDCQKFNIKQ